MKLDEKTKQYRNTVCLEIKQKILNLKYFQTLSWPNTEMVNFFCFLNCGCVSESTDFVFN